MDLVKKYLGDAVSRRKVGGPELKYKGFDHPTKKHVQGITKWLSDFQQMVEYENFKGADQGLKVIKKAFGDLEKSYKKTKERVKSFT